MLAFDISDDPNEIIKYQKYFFKKPMLLNIRTHRIFWHAGVGKDSIHTFDRYKIIKNKIGKEATSIDENYMKKMDTKWQKQLEK